MPAKAINYGDLSRELLTALRGERRSRPGFSRHLGYKSNIAQRWETGLCAPTATQFFHVCERLRLDVAASIARFLRNEPGWLGRAPLSSGEGLAAFLNEVRGNSRIGEIASQLGHNRYGVARWFRGTAVPRLPDLLALLDACTGRCLDFVGSFVDVEQLPSVSARAGRLRQARELAYEHPLSHAVLRALELERAGDGTSDEAFVARRVGIGEPEVEHYLKLLQRAGQLHRTRTGALRAEQSVVDTGGDPERARSLKLAWAKLAVARLESGAPGHCGYRVFAIGKRELLRLREIELAYVREMQQVIASSEHNDSVGLYCAQLLDLGVAEENAFPLPRGRRTSARL
ncbi:MAG TPA: DUF4423 domain-containing protein [Polyangiaceae bacterium]|nr:DUF4423 domain-containing protein [Polyangiaceae bacterium]